MFSEHKRNAKKTKKKVRIQIYIISNHQSLTVKATLNVKKLIQEADAFIGTIGNNGLSVH